MNKGCSAVGMLMRESKRAADVTLSLPLSTEAPKISVLLPGSGAPQPTTPSIQSLASFTAVVSRVLRVACRGKVSGHGSLFLR